MRFQGATRTEPYGRISRIRLPPRVFDGEAFARAKDEGYAAWEPTCRQVRRSAATSFRPSGCAAAACATRGGSHGHGTPPGHRRWSARHDRRRSPPTTCRSQSPCSSIVSCIRRRNPPWIACSRARIRSRRVFRISRKPSAPAAPADVGEAKKVERLRLAFTTLSPVQRRKAAEPDQARLLPMQRQSKRSPAARASPPGTARLRPDARSQRRCRRRSAP